MLRKRVRGQNLKTAFEFIKEIESWKSVRQICLVGYVANTEKEFGAKI